MTSVQPFDSASVLTSDSPSDSTPRKWAPGLCVWCGDAEGVELSANEHRCAQCREHEAVIADARRFIGMYGLRPLGGSLDSDDDEEREHRAGARAARAALNAVKLADPPTRDQIRQAVERGDSALARMQAHVIVDEPAPVADSPAADAAETASAPTAPAEAETIEAVETIDPVAPAEQASAAPAAQPAPRTRRAPRAGTRSSRAVTVDAATLESRVGGLLDRLTAVEAQLAELGEPEGLAARARVKDLERERTRVLGTLAALEKARRAQLN